MFNELIRTSNLLTRTQFILKSVSCDFESGLISAAKELFPECEIQGCLFHLNQSLFRKIQALGLLSFYLNDEEFAISIRRINALPLLPLNLIDSTFESLIGQILQEFANSPQIDKINQLIDYYNDTYVKEDAMFPKEQWNQYRKSRRTNNEVEGFYNKFVNLFFTDHPNFYVVVNQIKILQEEFEKTIESLKKRGFYEPKKNNIYSKINERLNDLWDQLDSGGISALDFLSAAQFLLSAKK